MLTYRIRRISSRKAHGVTQASFCTLDAVLKFDSAESPYCVYNEMVAEQLARLLQVPVARGAITSTGDGPAFASLQVASPGISLPEMLPSQAERVANKYPKAAAALVAFDLWIGNWDRASNLKASLVSPHVPLICGYDHSHALLAVDEDPMESCRRLADGDLIVRVHPFYGHVAEADLRMWMQRIEAINDAILREVCVVDRAFRAVTQTHQQALAEALVQRSKKLLALAVEHTAAIRPMS